MPPWRRHLIRQGGGIEGHHHHSTRSHAHRGKTFPIPIHTRLRIEAVQCGQRSPDALRASDRQTGNYAGLWDQLPVSRQSDRESKQLYASYVQDQQGTLIMPSVWSLAQVGAFVAFALTSCSSLIGQTENQLEQRYNRPNAFEVRPGVNAYPMFAPDGSVCRMVIAKFPKVDNKRVDMNTTIPPTLIKEIEDELPPPMREAVS